MTEKPNGKQSRPRNPKGGFAFFKPKPFRKPVTTEPSKAAGAPDDLGDDCHPLDCIASPVFLNSGKTTVSALDLEDLGEKRGGKGKNKSGGNEFAGTRCQAPKNGAKCGAILSQYNPLKVPICVPCATRLRQEEFRVGGSSDIDSIWKRISGQDSPRKKRVKNPPDRVSGVQPISTTSQAPETASAPPAVEPDLPQAANG